MRPQSISPNGTQRKRLLKLLRQTAPFSIGLLLSILLAPNALAHGFNANFVQISRLLNGKFRVTIQYTHVEVGEYRQAHVDFDSKEEAIKTYQDLAQGADFFLGDLKKSIHFHNPPEKNKPL